MYIENYHCGRQNIYAPTENERIPYSATYGVELELEGLDQYVADPINEHDRLFKLEYDGSLDNGSEVIFDFGSLQNWKRWQLNNQLIDLIDYFMDYDIYAADTCGLHIHAGNLNLSKLDKFKLLKIFNRKNDATQFWFNISRREDFSDFEYWSDLYHFDSDLEIADNLERIDRFDRRKACNFKTEEGSVEFRLFASSTDPDKIIGSILIIDYLIEFVKNNSIKKMKPVYFYGFLLKKVKNDRKLRKYLKACNLL